PDPLTMSPPKAPGPMTSMPMRLEPVANAPPSTPVLPSTVAVYDMPRLIVPPLPTWPALPPCTRMPVVSLTSVLVMAPPLATVMEALLELRTTPASPVFGVTVQPESMLRLPAEAVVVPAAGHAAHA